MIYFIVGFITGATIGTFFMHQAKVYENKIEDRKQKFNMLGVLYSSSTIDHDQYTQAVSKLVDFPHELETVVDKLYGKEVRKTEKLEPVSKGGN